MLRLGKLKESVYHRSVLKQVHNEKGDAPVFTKTISVEGWILAAERVLANMQNAFYAAQSSLLEITVSVTMPEGSEEPVFRSFTTALGKLCAREKIWLLIEEVRVTKAVNIPLIQAVGFGPMNESVKRTRLPAGLDLVVAGTVACEGAAILALEHEAKLKERFASFYVEIAQKLFDAAAMPAVQGILEREEAYGTAVREGGIFAGLWEMAAAGKVGLDIDLSAIPIRQHTIEVCEYFNRNPYMLLSGGCMIIAARHGERVVSALMKEEIPAAIIGHTTEGNDRIIHYDDEIRYLEPPKTDEIYKEVNL